MAPVTPSCSPAPTDEMTDQERAVLDVLIRFSGRVINRHELARQSGLADRSDRRCDAILVGLRRRLGADSIRTVRSRGWILEPAALERARTLLT